jgi:hypothetical protein
MMGNQLSIAIQYFTGSSTDLYGAPPSVNVPYNIASNWSGYIGQLFAANSSSFPGFYLFCFSFFGLRKRSKDF